MPTLEKTANIHHGRNVKRFREMFGIKQEALALELGDEWSQKKVSRLEENAKIDDEILEKVANVLHVPIEAIKHFDEQAANAYFNTFHVNSGEGSFSVTTNTNCSFNPLDKLMEAIEEIKTLYERIVVLERERAELLQLKR